MPTINILHGFNGTKGETVENVIRNLSRTFAAQTLVAAAITPLTDNSAGGGSAFTIPAKASAVAASGSNIATSASFNTAIGTVKDAIATLYAKANAINAALGLPSVTYNGGGTSGGNTVAAVTKTTTGGTTGVQLAEYEAIRLATNGQLTRLKGIVDTLARALGVSKIPDIAGQTGAAGAIGTTSGAAAPGISKAKADSDLAAWANNIAVVAAKLNAILAVTNKPQVLVVG